MKKRGREVAEGAFKGRKETKQRKEIRRRQGCSLYMERYKISRLMRKGRKETV